MPEPIGQMLQAVPAPPATLGNIPRPASDAILRAIDARPAHRFRPAEAFRQALSLRAPL